MIEMPTIVVTGGAGFIGSALCRYLVQNELARVVNVDALTYAANLSAVEMLERSGLYNFVKADICDAEAMAEVFQKYQPDGVIHLAAESHVDRSISGPQKFIQTNVVGTTVLLEAALDHWRGLEGEKKAGFKLLNVSTDEVYGSLGAEGLFTEETAYDPSSPYSASKAAADHLVGAWWRTYGLPVVSSNCSNNYGSYQHSEKLIPLMIQHARAHKKLPIYGDGANVRDWLFVDDHVKALWMIWNDGRVGETYNVGGRNEKTNLEVVTAICKLVDEFSDDIPAGGHASLIEFVTDRPGHDARYAIDASKLESELGWRAEEDFGSGLRETVLWYLGNKEECEILLTWS